jgi:hypothetical protein
MSAARIPRALFLPASSSLVLAFDAQHVQRIFLTTNVGASCSDTPEFGVTGNACAPSGTPIPSGTSVTVTGSGQNPGSGFVGWTGGPCAGLRAAACTFTITGATTVVGRTGGLVNPTVSIDNTAGTTAGTVTIATFRGSQPFSAGPGSGALNSATYFTGDSVTVTASTTGGNAFVGWGEGACESFGSNPVCTILVTGEEGVIAATFATSALRAPTEGAARRQPARLPAIDPRAPRRP